MSPVRKTREKKLIMADGDADGDKPTEVRLLEVSGSASCSLLSWKANPLHVRTLQIRKLNQSKTAKENEL